MVDMDKQNKGLRSMIMTALMIALIFIGGSFFKIPTVNGFMQFGDCMVFLAAILLSKKRAASAAAIGMALVDVAAGYVLWAPFTFIIKGIMAYVTALIIEKSKVKSQKLLIFSFIIGGVIDVVGYFIANAIMGGLILKVVNGVPASIAYAVAHLPSDASEIIISIIVAIPLTAIVRQIKK